MKIVKSFIVYADHSEAGGRQAEIWYETFEEARETAALWLAQGAVLVHIRKQVTETSSSHPETKPEELVWAAASPDIDWRNA